MMFAGSKFCPHCGAAAEKPVEVGSALDCPVCRVRMKLILLKQTPLQECQQCFGIWVDATSFERICADRERQADVLAQSPAQQQEFADALKRHIVPQTVRYRPCPKCGQLMNRFNFGHTSGVVIDQCKGHGIWFDKDELRRIVEFVRAGGLGIARQREAQAQVEALSQSLAFHSTSASGAPDLGLSVRGAVGRWLF
jgi:Zn-finger nucleic acid-binding protein